MALAVLVQRGIQRQFLCAKEQRRHLLQRLAQRYVGVHAEQLVVVLTAGAEGDGAEGFDWGMISRLARSYEITSCHFWFSGKRRWQPCAG